MAYRIPLVDGTSPAARGSTSTATRRALATALKTPSTMWCELRPDSSRMCSVIPAELLQHVVEEPDAGGDLRHTRAVEVDRHADGRLLRRALDLAGAAGGGAHGTSVSAAGRSESDSASRNFSSWAAVPAETRRQPSHPGVDEKSRTSTPRSRRRRHTSGAGTDSQRNRTKLAW